MVDIVSAAHCRAKHNMRRFMQTFPSTTLKASASFDVRPARSQVVLVGLTVASIVALLLGGMLLALDKASGWAFVGISAVLCIAIVWCWRQSHRDTDLAQAHPTKVILADGANLSTDSRLLSSPEGVRNVAQLLEALALQHPLPEPTGLAGPGGVAIPNTKQEALVVVQRINSGVQRSHDHAISLLQGQLTNDSIVQVSNAGSRPPIDAEATVTNVNALLRVNDELS